ncbi:TPM domain-containing protein [Prosthecobacter fusiformis]|uniref:TPM domain-containing protein n=1 Tax=Prosthecobacter fusiformis TaxID=48464 RepID=UPI001414F6BA|nr:TPM domain-containing protein [Prosthecobacter fusiformis]
MSTVRTLLGADWVRLERLTDNANCLSLKEHRALEIVLDDFERRFPQCFFAIYLGTLPASLTAADLGFWLINHGAFHTQQIAKRNDFGTALVIDCQRHVAALTLGYALESHIHEAELRHILSQMNSFLNRRRYGQALENAVGLFGRRLAQSATRTLPDVPPGPGTGDLGGMGLQPLRAAHRHQRTGTKA